MPVTKTESETINAAMRRDADLAMEKLVEALQIAIPACRVLLRRIPGGRTQTIWAVTGADLWPHRRKLFAEAAVVVEVLLRLGWVGLVRGSQSGSDEKPTLPEDQ